MYEPAETLEVRGALKLRESHLPEDPLEFCKQVNKGLEENSQKPLGEIEGKLVPSLLLYPAGLETRQLRCARKNVQIAENGKEYTERPCAYGKECVAFCIPGGPGEPLMESQCPSDFISLLKTGRDTFDITPKPCVLCRRTDVAKNIVRLNMTSDITEDFLCQEFYNNVYPEGDPQVYRRECCIMPDSGQKGTNGLFAPVAEFRKEYHKWIYKKEEWWIDQSSMLYGSKKSR